MGRNQMGKNNMIKTYASEEVRFEKLSFLTCPNKEWIVSRTRRIGETRFIGRRGGPLDKRHNENLTRKNLHFYVHLSLTLSRQNLSLRISFRMFFLMYPPSCIIHSYLLRYNIYLRKMIALILFLKFR